MRNMASVGRPWKRKDKQGGWKVMTVLTAMVSACIRRCYARICRRKDFSGVAGDSFAIRLAVTSASRYNCGRIHGPGAGACPRGCVDHRGWLLVLRTDCLGRARVGGFCSRFIADWGLDAARRRLVGICREPILSHLLMNARIFRTMRRASIPGWKRGGRLRTGAYVCAAGAAIRTRGHDLEGG